MKSNYRLTDWPKMNTNCWYTVHLGKWIRNCKLKNLSEIFCEYLIISFVKKNKCLTSIKMTCLGNFHSYFLVAETGIFYTNNFGSEVSLSFKLYKLFIRFFSFWKARNSFVSKVSGIDMASFSRERARGRTRERERSIYAYKKVKK